MNIYLRMRGGLGNQLFQYSYAMLLKQDNKEAQIYLDTREYKNYKIRSFELNQFLLDSDTYILNQESLPYDKWMRLYSVYRHIYTRLFKNGPTNINKLLCKKGYIFGGRSSPLPSVKLPDNIYLYGYFQNAEILNGIRDKLVKCFTLKNSSKKVNQYAQQIDNKSVAVCIRRGSDFAKCGLPIYGRDYYESSIKYIQEKDDCRQAVIFSDCIEQIQRENWFINIKVNTLFITDLTPCEQIEIMRLCKNFIISNSSFAWWGAYLGAYGKKSIIIAPEIWNEYSTKTKNMKLMFEGMKII